MSPQRRRSACVPLLLAGSLLAGCEQAPIPLRDLYLREADCRTDWGENATCEPTTTAGGGTGWYGPTYPHGKRRTSGRDNRYGVVDTRNGNIEYGRGNMLVQNWNARAAAAQRGTVSTDSSGTSRGGFGASARGSSGG
jgi:hypothetical protein